MKKSAAAICSILAVLLFSSCRPVPAEILLEPGTAELSVPAGTVLVLRLPGNPTTGYQWQVQTSGGGLEIFTEEYTPSRPELIGSGGIFSCTIGTKAPGSGTVTARYFRSWEGFDPETGKEHIWQIEATGP